jgi:hypothetical protein
MKPHLKEASGMPNSLLMMIPRESARFTVSRSGAHAQKTTEWPFVLEFMVDFIHFRPEILPIDLDHGSQFTVRSLELGFGVLGSDSVF